VPAEDIARRLESLCLHHTLTMRPAHDSRRYGDRDPPERGYGQAGYAPEPARGQTPNWRWWIPAEGISRDVIQADIQRYLGPEALVRPGEGTEQYAVRCGPKKGGHGFLLTLPQGVPGYWIAAYRTLTSVRLYVNSPRG
jgi:hypothetical protein